MAQSTSDKKCIDFSCKQCCECFRKFSDETAKLIADYKMQKEEEERIAEAKRFAEERRNMLNSVPIEKSGW